MKAIFERKSIRFYKDTPVEDEKLDKLLRAAMQAPSAGNQQPWEFIVVTEKSLIEALAEVSPYSKPAGRAPLDIVVLGNMEGLKYPQIWTHDMGAVCENILLEAEYLGLGAVWMALEPAEERIENTRKLFNLPENVKPFAIISVGYPDEDKQATDRFDPTRVHYNAY